MSAWATSLAFLRGSRWGSFASSAAVLLAPEHGAAMANRLRLRLLQGSKEHLGIDELPLLLFVQGIEVEHAGLQGKWQEA
jgi:hypothetical protein